jgi:hypothetical protein
MKEWESTCVLIYCLLFVDVFDVAVFVEMILPHYYGFFLEEVRDLIIGCLFRIRSSCEEK